MKKFSILGIVLLLVATTSLAFAQAKTVSLQMKAVEGSKITGTAVVSEITGGGTKVVVNLSGYAANQGSAGHIHEGTCEVQGKVVFPLTTLTADASGKGTAESSLANAPYATVTNGKHYVQYHEAASPAGKQVTCANIVLAAAAGGQGGAAPSSAPATGVGGAVDGSAGFPTALVAGLVALLMVAGAGLTVARGRK